MPIHHATRDSHATPAELRARAKQHLAKWRELLPDDPVAAREELARASNLAMLADEAESAAMGRLGE